MIRHSIIFTGNFGNGNVEGGENESDILYGQRGIYKEQHTAGTLPTDETEKHTWKYSPLSAPVFSNITPLSTYLFSEIKRGPDGKLYMPNLAEQATQIQTWDAANFNQTASLSSGANYELTGSMPTQVYKIFSTNTVGFSAGRNVGNKQYELKDHLGNVRVVSDLKIHNNGINGGNNLTTIDAGDYFSADVKSFSDYYPFGSALSSRTFAAESYRYGFQGEEKENDVVGEGLVFEYRIYDARIGKFLSVDPLVTSGL